MLLRAVASTVKLQENMLSVIEFPQLNERRPLMYGDEVLSSMVLASSRLERRSGR